MGWCDSTMFTAAEDVKVKEKLQIYQESGGGQEEIVGEKPDDDFDTQFRQPYGRVKPFWKKRVNIRVVVSFIGETFGSLILWVVSSCFRSSPPRLMPPAAPDALEDGGERLLHRESGSPSCVHVTLVNNRVNISDVVSSTGDGLFDADLAAVTVLPPESITAAHVAEVLAPASDIDAVGVATEEATTVNLGSLDDPIEVGVLSRSDFELILQFAALLVDTP